MQQERPRCGGCHALAFATLLGALLCLACSPSAEPLLEGGRAGRSGRPGALGGPVVARQLEEEEPLPENPLAHHPTTPPKVEDHAEGEAPEEHQEPGEVLAPLTGAEEEAAEEEAHMEGVEEHLPFGEEGHGEEGHGGAEFAEHGEEGGEHGEFGEHGEGEHGEEGGHHEHFSASEWGLSLTLICIVMIALILFFFLNSEDADIVCYTWDLLGKGTNVFVAVMVFLMLVEICHHLWGHRSWLWCTLVMQVIVVALIFINLWATKNADSPAIGRSKRRFVGEVDYSKITKKAVISMTFGSIQAHLAAFTMIFFWGHVMWIIYSRQLFWEGSVAAVAVIVPVAFAVRFLLTGLLTAMRFTVASYDGMIDEDERAWLRRCEEVDSEAGGLEVSFLAMQVIRYILAGRLPTPDGSFHGRVPAPTEKYWLLLLAFISFGTGLFLRRELVLARAAVEGLSAEKIEREEEEMEEEESETSKIEVRKPVTPAQKACFHLMDLVVGFCTFLSGWALFFTFELLMKGWALNDPGERPDVMLIRTSVALMCSVVVFTIICCMDKIVDRMQHTQMDITKEAEKIIAVVGMMMGFAWERTFHHAFEVSAEGAVDVIHDKIGLKILLSELGVFIFTGSIMALASILVMYWYINPRALESRAKCKYERAVSNMDHGARELMMETSEELEDGYRDNGGGIVGGYRDEDRGNAGGGYRGGLAGLWDVGGYSAKQDSGYQMEDTKSTISYRQEEPSRSSADGFLSALFGSQRPAPAPQQPDPDVAAAQAAALVPAVAPLKAEPPPQSYYYQGTPDPGAFPQAEVHNVKFWGEEAESEAVPFPVQRRRQEEHLSNMGFHGQAPWAQSRSLPPMGMGMPPGGMPPGSMPPGAMPPGSMPPGAWPPQGPPMGQGYMQRQAYPF